MATIEPMEYEEYLMHCRGSSSTIAGLQKHMIRHMLWLARNDPNCQYTAEQGSAISHFIRSYCARGHNYEWVLPDDSFNDLRLSLN